MLDEVILFNVEWWYYFIIFTFSLILVFIILNRPILKRKLIETGYWKYIILGNSVDRRYEFIMWDIGRIAIFKINVFGVIKFVRVRYYI